MTKVPTLLAALCALFLASCASVSNPGAVTSDQQVWASAAEDLLALGLTPVLAHNPDYLAAAKTAAAALDAFSGSTITPEDVNAFIVKTPLSPADAKTAAGVINAAWGVFARHYQQKFGSAIRPDVKLFLSAASNGIMAAAAAVPKN